MNNNWNLLLNQAEKFNIALSPAQIEQFKDYWRILSDYNEHTNLVSNTEPEIVIIKHFIDSLSIGLLKDKLGWNDSKRLIDIGIGGGFPGIPIIIANPEWKLCAVDSIGKKTKFIELLASELGIADRVEVINSRAEELARDVDKREKFDIVISRAVSQLAVLSEYCLPFVKKSGYFVAYKAKDIDQELKEAKNALNVLGGTVDSMISYLLPENEPIERKLILIQKTKITPAKYPRKAGIPKKQPL